MSVVEPTTSLAATVADEQDEIMAESSGAAATASTEQTSASAPAPVSADEAKPADVDGEKPAGDEDDEEKKVDPNAIPEDACVTLYLQNLNEKVRLPGKSDLVYLMQREFKKRLC
jgi:hypothetical protein